MESGLKVISPMEAKSPWATSTHAPCSLATVMDEELAKKLQHDEEQGLKQDFLGPSNPLKLLSTAPSPPDTDSDVLLAQMLQLEFDREHDHMINAEEKHYNKHNRVHVSFEKYRSLPSSYLYDDDPSSGDHDDDEDEDDIYEPTKKTTPPCKGKRRSKGVPVGMATKHDPEICGRKNVRNMEKFPPDFPAGDMSGDYRLPNNVFNTLKQHSLKEEKHAQRLHEKKEHSTHEQALDEKTRLLLFKMVDADILKEVNGCVSTGKEACVYHALGGKPEDHSVPEECAVKVFKTTLNEFKNRDWYIRDDYRFKGRYRKQNSRQLVQLWAEKEMHNLRRLTEGGVLCPEVVLLKKHVLVMSFIGQDQVPAPTLKDASLSREQLSSAYQQCIQGMKKMYRKCHLIHADLSEYNMLWNEGKVVFIDVGQSVEPSHPHGLEFLFRDCYNVSRFFSGRVENVLDSQQLFNFVTGMAIQEETDDAFLIQVRTHTKRESVMQCMHNKTDYPFNYFFEHSSAKNQTTSTLEGEGCENTSTQSSETVSRDVTTEQTEVKGDELGDFPTPSDQQ